AYYLNSCHIFPIPVGGSNQHWFPTRDGHLLSETKVTPARPTMVVSTRFQWPSKTMPELGLMSEGRAMHNLLSRDSFRATAPARPSRLVYRLRMDSYGCQTNYIRRILFKELKHGDSGEKNENDLIPLRLHIRQCNEVVKLNPRGAVKVENTKRIYVLPFSFKRSVTEVNDFDLFVDRNTNYVLDRAAVVLRVGQPNLEDTS
ncbi:LOW QUALITY PROTEIN: hypothetical protein V1478_008282, partial [Vespula squamosa]